MDPLHRRKIFPRRGRHQHVARHADYPSRHDRHHLLLERHPAAHQGVLHPAPSAPDGDARRFSVSRLLPLLRLLGSHARPDVFPNRCLGQRAPPLRRNQIFSVHARRLRHHAARDPGTLLQLHKDSSAGRRRHLRHSHFSRCRSACVSFQR